MNEYSYSEYAITVRQTGKMRAKQIAVIGATAVSLVLALMVYWAFLVLTVAGAVGCYLAYLSSDMDLGRKEEAVRLGKITRDFSSQAEGRTCCVMKVSTDKGDHVICFEPGSELEEILEKRYRMLKA